MRIDKWLWAVRLFKTRSQAADACKGGKIKMEGHNVKPSREVKAGDEITIQLQSIEKKVQVKQVLKNRVGAKLVEIYLIDLTPEEEYEKLKLMRKMNTEYWDRGSGRPTKKTRRMIDQLKNPKG
ncbi:MAG: RNA-binding S4 domain-containing protein [Bacteroidetes bacterium]|nr:MAG: RNA-binding S4 domain-containing protein [Bacteroidota bacterium]